MTSEDRMMLWNLTLGYPLFRAKIAREEVLLTRMTVKAGFQEYVLRRLEETDNPPALERVFNRTDAEWLALEGELTAVASRVVGKWEDVSWLLRNVVSRFEAQPWLTKTREAATLTWVAFITPVRFVWYMAQPSIPSAASTLANIDQTEAEWGEHRKANLRFIDESEALGWYSPEKAAAERRRIHKETQDIHERLRRAKEACWLTE